MWGSRSKRLSNRGDFVQTQGLPDASQWRRHMTWWRRKGLSMPLMLYCRANAHERFSNNKWQQVFAPININITCTSIRFWRQQVTSTLVDLKHGCQVLIALPSEKTRLENLASTQTISRHNLTTHGSYNGCAPPGLPPICAFMVEKWLGVAYPSCARPSCHFVSFTSVGLHTHIPAWNWNGSGLKPLSVVWPRWSRSACQLGVLFRLSQARLSVEKRQEAHETQPADSGNFLRGFRASSTGELPAPSTLILDLQWSLSKALFIRKISELTCLWTLHPTSNTRHVKLQCPNTSPSASGAGSSAEWRQQGNEQFGLDYCHDSLEHRLSSKTTFCQPRLFAAYFTSPSGAIGVVLSYISYLLPWMGQAFDNKVTNQSV